MNTSNAAQKTAFHAFFFPVSFVCVIWFIKLAEITFGYNLYHFGVYPRRLEGMAGIITSPLIHADFGHLFSNSVPLLLLGSGLFYYYKSLAYRIFFFIMLASGLWVWIGARQSYHIGASGIVYGLAAFMFVSGLIKKNIHLWSFALVVVFLYGNLIWGVLPLLPHVSWESHLMGAIAGILLAWYYRKDGPKITVYEWQHEPIDAPTKEQNTDLVEQESAQNRAEDIVGFSESVEFQPSPLRIVYTMKKDDRPTSGETSAEHVIDP